MPAPEQAMQLILVRHGQSEWNLKNLFTGWRNPDLTEKGIEEARSAGKRLKAAGYVPDSYFTSARRRNSHPKTSGSTIQMAVVEPSMAHSLAVSVPPSNSATCV